MLNEASFELHIEVDSDSFEFGTRKIVYGVEGWFLARFQIYDVTVRPTRG